MTILLIVVLFLALCLAARDNNRLREYVDHLVAERAGRRQMITDAWFKTKDFCRDHDVDMRFLGGPMDLAENTEKAMDEVYWTGWAEGIDAGLEAAKKGGWPGP